MAIIENDSKQGDRSSKKKPFAWMKKLALLKSTHGSSQTKKGRNSSPAKKHEPNALPYAQDSVSIASPGLGKEGGIRFNGEHAYQRSEPVVLPNGSRASLPHESNSEPAMAESNKSTAPTVETNSETINSDGGQSKALTSGTVNTAGGAMSNTSGGGGNSIFSSSNPSARSLTTTLTTIQSNVPVGQQGQSPNTSGPGHQHQASQSSTYFSHQYPTTPASAIPAHLNPHSVHIPMTYRSATANNLLTDNASVLTLASSSQAPHRRNSLDTNASVRAIPPSSVWGGSRESLPLSVVSRETGHTEVNSSATQQTQQSLAGGIYTSQQRPSIGGLASTERASVYSSSGATPQATGVNSSRNSVHASKSINADGSSVRSGLTGHGRQDSLGGSISGMTSQKESTVTTPGTPGGFEGQSMESY